MKNSSAVFILLLMLFAWDTSLAQKNVTTFGLVVRPGFPNQFLGAKPLEFSDSTTFHKIDQNSGISFGGLVRHGITNRLSLETGIIYTKRNYQMSITDTTFTGKSDFSIIGYEIPVSALVFIQLDEKLWMDVGLGANLNIFPSDVTTYRDYFIQFSARKQKVNGGVMGHLGVEYRTKKSGYFYLGFVYLRSLGDIYQTLVEYYPERDFDKLPTTTGRTFLGGDYLGIDFKYFFHEDPEKREKRKKKK
jgi:hypothetical protein